VKVLNRAAVTIKPKQPFADWVNSTDSEQSFSLADLSEENTVYLIPEFDSPHDSMDYVKNKYQDLFEHELFGWYTDEDAWPQKRTWKMFQEWFKISINSMLIDLDDIPLELEDF